MWDISCVSQEMFIWFVLMLILVAVMGFSLGRNSK
jgi:hypothetical protein